MKIIHISDLHLCNSFKRTNISRVKSLLRHVSELGAAHLVITGDISDNADSKDFRILKKILQAYNLYSSEKTTIIPGNHDIFGGVQKAEDIPNFPSKCKNVNYNEKVNIFFENFKELYENTYFPDSGSPFPFAKPLDGVVLLGMNTVDKYSKFKNPLASNGKVHRKQFDSLVEILTAKSFGNYRKIVLSHHHFYKNCHEVKSSESAIWNKIEKYTMKLRGKRRLLNAFSSAGVELVLHGHSHDMKEYNRRGITFLNAGSSIESIASGKGQMMIINITGEGMSTKIYTLPDKKPAPEKISAK